MRVGDRLPRALELAQEARTHVAQAIQLLQRPDVEAFDRSTVLLAAAVERMRQIQTEGAGMGGMAAQSAIRELRNDLRRVRLLLGHAWEFRAGCCGQAVYTSKGELTARSSAVGHWTFEA
jgi:hypothetical protein